MIKPSLQKQIYPQLSNQRTKEFRHIIYNYILRRKKMLQKNLSKISTHTHTSTYIYIHRGKILPPHIRQFCQQPLPGIVGDSHSKSPHILTTSFPRSNVLKRPSDSTPPLLLYPLFTPSTFHRSPPLISPPIPSSVFVRAHTHGRHTHTYLSGQWMMEGGHERVVPSIPFDLATVIFFQIPPSSIPHPSSSIPIETKREEGGGGRICVRYGNLGEGSMEMIYKISFWKENYCSIFVISSPKI